MKTIRMKKEILDKWLTALRSGEYEQAQGYLEAPIVNTDKIGYCCLGVLQMVCDGKVETENDSAKAFPSMEWLNEHGIEFVEDSNGSLGSDPRFVNIVNERVYGDDGIRGADSAAGANDGGFTFAEIADLIERHTEIVP